MADWAFPNQATPPGSDLYYVARFAASRQRNRLAALFALRHKWRVQNKTLSDPGVARLQLAWWREELARLGQRQAKHPALLLLLPEAARPDFGEHFEQLLDTVDEELCGLQFPDQAALSHFCERSGAALVSLILLLEGVEPDAVWSKQIGRALCLVDLLQRLVEERHRGRCPLPRNWLEQAGTSPGGFMRDSDAKTAACVARALQLAADWLEQAKPQGPWPSRALQRWWRMQRAWIKAVSDQPAELLTHQVNLTPLHNLWLCIGARG